MDIFIHIAHAAESAPDGVAATLGLDWKLFLAQLINFALIVIVLWKWVFTPILKKLHDRSTRLEQAIDNATNLEQQQQDFESWKQAETNKAIGEAQKIIAHAKAQADALTENQKLTIVAEQEKLIAQSKAKIEKEAQKANIELQASVTDLVIKATEAVIKEKLDAKADAKLIETAISKTLEAR